VDVGDIVADAVVSSFVTTISFILLYSNAVNIGTSVSIAGACGHCATRLLSKIDDKIIKAATK
jgi:hypothetical protein